MKVALGVSGGIAAYKAAEIVRMLQDRGVRVQVIMTHAAQEFIRPVPNEAGNRPSRTRQWIIWHLVEHDVHHGGEISFSLGMHGVAGLDL